MRTEAAKGRPVMGGFKEASHKFGSEWTEMSTDQRVPYVKLANEAKGKDKSNLHNKFTTTGESYAQVNERARQKQAAHQKMESFIRNLTSGPDADNRNYIFMKVNYSVEEIREDGARVFWPVEIAMAVFNLKEGLQSFYTTFVDTLAVPCGYSSLAVETAKDTLIPLPGDSSFPEDAKNYKEILRKIFGFLNHWIKDKEGYDTDHERVVFCLDSEVKPIRTGLQWMADKLEEFHNEKYCYLVEDLKIYSISKLILGMAQEAYKLNPSYDNCAVKYQVEGSAESIILKGSYDFSDELTCMFHCSEERRIKMQNCAQNIVLRRVFLLFDEFIQPNASRYEKRDRHKIEFVNKVDTLCPVIKKHVRPKVVPVNIVLPDWLKDEPEVSLEDPQLSASASNDDDNRPQTSDERRNENQEDVDVPSEQVPDDVERDWLNDSRDPGRPDVSMEEPQLSPPASNSYDNRPRTGVKRRNDERSPSPEGACGGSFLPSPSRSEPSYSTPANEPTREAYPPEEYANNFGFTRNSPPTYSNDDDDFPALCTSQSRRGSPATRSPSPHTTTPVDEDTTAWVFQSRSNPGGSRGRGSSLRLSTSSNSFGIGIGRGIGNPDSSNFWFEEFPILGASTSTSAGRGIGRDNLQL